MQPSNPIQALMVAEAHCRAVGLPHMAPTTYCRAVHETTAGLLPWSKLTAKEILPGTKFRAGASTVEITQLLPTSQELIYKNIATKKTYQITVDRFLQLANQQGYRKLWDLKTFLMNLKNLLKPVLAAIPLMWVLKWVVNTIRKKPIRFATDLPKHPLATPVKESMWEHRKSNEHHHTKKS
jgi:hypothetical protein